MPGELFSGDLLETLGEEAVEALAQAVLDLDPDRLTETPRMIDDLVKPHTPAVPTLQRDRIFFERFEAELDGFDLLSRPRKRWGLGFSFHIPFEGDPRFFSLAGGGPLATPEGSVEDHCLVLTVLADPTEDEIAATLEARIEQIESVLRFQARYVERLGQELRKTAEAALKARVQRLGRLDRVNLALVGAGYRNASAVVQPLHHEAS